MKAQPIESANAVSGAARRRRREAPREPMRSECRFASVDDGDGDEMPKMKTHRGSAKRFSLTGTGKLKRNKAGKQHILTKKRTKRKRPMRQHDLVSDADASRVKRSLPYL